MIKKDWGSYFLRLANDQKWQIMADKGMEAWVEKLAWMMELKTCDSNVHPKLIFTRKRSSNKEFKKLIGSLDQNIRIKLPGKGWTAFALFHSRLWFHCNIPDVICEIEYQAENDHDKMLLSVHSIYQRTQDSEGLPFHAGLIELNGMGVLLAACGGTGKSTCCLRIPSPWYAHCDDETLIVCDNKKQYQVHPFPTWSDYTQRGSNKTWNVMRHLPLCAIFFLEQAEIDEVIPLSQGKAAIYINQSAYQVWNRIYYNIDTEKVRPFKRKLFDNACQLAKKIPAYILRVSLNGTFWKNIEQVLNHV